MRIKNLPAGFISPAQPVMASKTALRRRMIARREGPTVRLYSRNANNWAIVGHCDCCPAHQGQELTIDGEAVV
jgi:hypothetical protein